MCAGMGWDGDGDWGCGRPPAIASIAVPPQLHCLSLTSPSQPARRRAQSSLVARRRPRAKARITQGPGLVSLSAPPIGLLEPYFPPPLPAPVRSYMYVVRPFVLATSSSEGFQQGIRKKQGTRERSSDRTLAPPPSRYSTASWCFYFHGLVHTRSMQHKQHYIPRSSSHASSSASCSCLQTGKMLYSEAATCIPGLKLDDASRLDAKAHFTTSLAHQQHQWHSPARLGTVLTPDGGVLTRRNFPRRRKKPQPVIY